MDPTQQAMKEAGESVGKVKKEAKKAAAKVAEAGNAVLQEAKLKAQEEVARVEEVARGAEQAMVSSVTRRAKALQTKCAEAGHRVRAGADEVGDYARAHPAQAALAAGAVGFLAGALVARNGSGGKRRTQGA